MSGAPAPSARRDLRPRRRARAAAPRRILAIAHKEWLHVSRDPRSLYLGLGMPVVLLLLFGFGVRFDVDHLPVRVVDEDGSATSRALLARTFASDELIDVGGAASGEEAHAIFSRNEGRALLVLPRGLEARVARGEPAEAQLLVDGVETLTATQVKGQAEAALSMAALRLSSDASGLSSGAPGLSSGASGIAVRAPVEVRLTTWFNPRERSELHLVPGLAGYILAIVSVLLTSLSVSREWERSSIQQLFVTPVRTREILLGKLLPYFTIGALAVLMIFAVGAWVFDVPLRGDPLTLATACVLFLLGMLGQGMLISVVSKSQMVATQLGTITSLLPSMLLSGFLFPIENMPVPLQLLSNAVPARYFVHTLRGVLLRGNGFSEVLPDLLMLAGFAALMFALGVRSFRRELA